MTIHYMTRWALTEGVYEIYFDPDTAEKDGRVMLVDTVDYDGESSSGYSQPFYLYPHDYRTTEEAAMADARARAAKRIALLENRIKRLRPIANGEKKPKIKPWSKRRNWLGKYFDDLEAE
jgi:hypothetical protein